jgi:hypothetical protein
MPSHYLANRTCRFLASVAVIPVALMGQVDSQQRSVFYGRIVDGREVVRVDPVTKRERFIVVGGAWRIQDLKVAPGGDRLTFLQVEAPVYAQRQYAAPPRASLVMTDTTGSASRVLARDVQRYTWCGSACIVVIQGIADETELGFAPLGGLIINASTGDSVRLPGPPHPTAVSWVPADSSVYLQYVGDRIVRYHLPTGRASVTSKRGLRFSADGRYYLVDPPSTSDAPTRVYDAGTDAEARAGSQVSRLGTPVMWLPSGGSHLLIRLHAPDTQRQPPSRRARLAVPLQSGPVSETDYGVYDVGNNRLVRTLKAHFPDWSAPPDAVPYVAGGRVNAIGRP